MRAELSLLCVLGVTLGGCASAITSFPVESQSLQDRRAGRTDGEVYFLPRAVIKAHVRVNAATGVAVVVDQPTFVPANTPRWNSRPLISDAEWKACAWTDDAIRGPFVLSHRITGFHIDDVTIETVDGLLKTVNAKTEEQVSDIATAVAKAAGARMGLETAETPADVEVLAVQFDPADCGDIAAANHAIFEAIRGPAIDKLKEFQLANPTGPASKIKLAAIQPEAFKIRVKNFAPFRFPPEARPSARDCMRGVCVPVMVPMVVAVQTGTIEVESQPFTIPNGSDPAVIPVSRSAFADVETKLTLTSGVLTKRQVVRGSEVLTIVTIPATVIGAYLTEVAGVFTKRKGAFDNEKAFRDAVAAEAAKADGKTKAEAAILAEGSKPLVRTGIAGLSRPPAARVTVPLSNANPSGEGGPPPVSESNDGENR